MGIAVPPTVKLAKEPQELEQEESVAASGAEDELVEDVLPPIEVDAEELPPIEAELGKLFANTYRYINFAISNQLYLIAKKFDADFARIHAAVTYKYPRLSNFPKAGFAGDPCTSRT